MAQAVIRNFVEDLTRLYDLPEPVVEFGSMQVEPDQDGDMRSLFGGKEFIGTDMRRGPGVDRIEDLRALSFADGEVGTALCLDTLEHCEDPPQACRELHRVVANGGFCIISSVMLFVIHGYPNDYFRFTPEAFRSMLSPFGGVFVAGVGDPILPIQVVGVGRKGPALDLDLKQLPSLQAAQREFEVPPHRVRMGAVDHSPREMARELIRHTPRLVSRRLRDRFGN